MAPGRFSTTKKSVATIDRYIRIPFLKAAIASVTRHHTKSKASGCSIKSCGKVGNVLSLADVQQVVWI